MAPKSTNAKNGAGCVLYSSLSKKNFSAEHEHAQRESIVKQSFWLQR